MRDSIETFSFTENLDFIVFLNNQEKGRPLTEYHLTIEADKSIGMLSATDKGFEIRDYSIEG